MGYTLLSETRPFARKDHRCIWCGQKIPKGEQYVAERSVFDGDMQNHHWHRECLADARADSEYEWEFMPYSNERPKLTTEQTDRGQGPDREGTQASTETNSVDPKRGKE